MKRLGIYFFWDKDGVVDDYVPYFLEKLKPFCDELCVVVNGTVNNKSHRILKNSCDTLLYRENIGFDSWAYKHAIEHYGYKYIAQNFDELLCCNFTFYGPIFPLSEMFDEMERRDCDFWGITTHPKSDNKLNGTIDVPEHIQSFFVAYKKTILQSEFFENYWKNLKPIENYFDAIVFHEFIQSNYYKSNGFKIDTYISKEKYNEKLKATNYIAYTLTQIKEDRIPTLKRKIFDTCSGSKFIFAMKNCTQSKLIEYVKNNTEYDVKLIEQNAKRTLTRYLKPKYKYLFNNFILNLKYFLAKKPKRKRKLLKKIAKFHYPVKCGRLVFYNDFYKSFN